MQDFEIHFASQMLLIERNSAIESGYWIPGGDQSYGKVGRNRVWAADRKHHLVLIDTITKTCAVVLEDGQPLRIERKAVWPGRDGNTLTLISPGGDGLYVKVVDCERASVIQSHPVGGWRSHYEGEHAVVTAEGRVVIPIQRSDKQHGIVSMDPLSGEREESLVPEEDYGHGFVAVSPDGRYCLRPDFTLVPGDTGGLLSNLFQVGKRSRRFGLSVQIWETLPLRFVRRLTIGWFSATELPNEDFYHGKTVVRKARGLRGELFGTICDVSEKLGLGPTSRARSGHFPEPYRSSVGDWGHMVANWEKFACLWVRNCMWAPDSKSFWHKAMGLVACTSLDGQSSPRMFPGRMAPCMQEPLRIEALPGYSARLHYLEGSALLKARLTRLPGEAQEIPESLDEWKPIAMATRKRNYEAAERIKRKLRTIEVPLASLEEADCILAIDALCDAVSGDLMSRVVESEIHVQFVASDRVWTEADFFAHVDSNCPKSAPALRRLIAALCAVPGIAGAELFSDGEEGIGIMSDAARAFARLDREPIPLLQAYGKLMDVEHEYSFVKLVVPALIGNVGWTGATIDFAAWLIMANFYNSIDHDQLWNEWGLGAAVESRYTPIEFGIQLELMLRKHASEPMEEGKQYRLWIVEALAREIRTKTPWTEQMFASLRRQVVN